jgi:tRNA nucleotidyltransferase/poly(A) polymerase
MKLPISVIETNLIFKNANHQLFVVGGAVRDFIIGEEPKDFDLVTDALPSEIETIILNAGGTCDLVGKAFGVVIANIFGDTFEIASFRSDEKGAERANITFVRANLLQDSERRDLRLNAMLWNIETESISFNAPIPA